MSAPVIPPMPAAPDMPGSTFEEALAAALGSTPAAETGPTADDFLAAASDPVVPPSAAADPVEPAPAPASPAKPELIPQALLDREAALEAREKATRAAEDRVKAIEAREAKAAAAFEADPVGYVRSMRPDLTQAQAAAVAERFYMHALGDQAPVEHRVSNQVSEAQRAVDAKLAEMQAKVDAAEATIREAQYAAQRAEYKAQLAAHAAAMDAAAHPILANIAKRNPEKYQELLYAEAARTYQESAAAGAKEPIVLTAAQAAAAVEVALKAHRDELYGPAPESANVPQAAPSQTLSNRDASVQPSRSPPGTLDDKTLRAAALKAAGLGHIPVWD